MPKALRHILSLLILALTLVSCRQDFELTTDYKETTILYGLLSTQDSVHYVRIQRGFIDSAENALQIAKTTDSIYYDELLEVSLLDEDENVIYPLERFDGSENGIAKDSGLFSSSSNILYRFNAKLNDSASYRIVAYHPRMGDTVTAHTTMVRKVDISVPSKQYVVNWTGGLKDNVGFTWRHEEGVGVYDLSARFWYSERKTGGPVKVKGVDFKVFTNKLIFNNQPGSLLGHNYRTAVFFQRVGGSIPVDSTVYRTADSITFIMAAGGIELGKLISNSQVRNGILSGMALPFYTNVENGYGIFSSIYRDTITNPIGPLTLDSLQNGRYTSELNFQ